MYKYCGDVAGQVSCEVVDMEGALGVRTTVYELRWKARQIISRLFVHASKSVGRTAHDSSDRNPNSVAIFYIWAEKKQTTQFSCFAALLIRAGTFLGDQKM